MTVTTTTARFSYVGDGNAGPDTATGIKVLASTDVKVYWNKASSGSGTPVTVGDTSTAMSTSGYLTLNTHYTVQNAGTDNDITITLVASGWTISSTLAYATSSDTLVVTREVPYTQPSNYQNNDTFDAETLEQSLDRSTMQIQQLTDVADRNFVFSSTLGDSDFNSASLSGTDFSTVRERASTIITGKTARANKVLGFDANGDVSTTQEIGSFLGNWAASTAYVARDIVKDASNSNIYICNTSHTSTGSTPVSSNTDVAKWTLIVDAASTTTSATASAGSATTSTAQAALSSDHRADAGKYAVTAEDSTFSLTATNGGTSGLYSAKHYQAKALANQTASATSATASAASATASSASEVAARNSAASVANTYDSFDDIYLGKMADSATQGTNPTTNGTWAKDSSAITVASGSNIKVGQVVTGTGMPSPPPNVLSVAGTAVVVSAPMAAAGSAVSLTFTGYGIYGTFNGTKDGPALDNDGNALATGALYFNTTDNGMKVYDGAAFIAASSASSASLVIHKFTASGSETSVASASFSPALSYTANSIIVFLNGVALDSTDYTASSGTTITGLSALAASDELVVCAFKSFTVSDTVSAASGGTFNGNVSFGDNNITNVGSIALDSISADGTEITISSDMETATNKKIKQKGAFMQSSTHQALFLGA